MEFTSSVKIREQRDSERELSNEKCIVSVKGTSQPAVIKDISKSGIAFIVDNVSPFKEAYKDYSTVHFEGEQGTMGRCKVARVDTFNNLGKGVIGCRLVNIETLNKEDL